MPRKTSPNISFYHYRIDFYDEEMFSVQAQKYYFTIKDICNEFNTSKFTVNKIINNQGERVRNIGLKNIKIIKDKQPVFKLVRNDDIFGEIDDIEQNF